MPLPNGIRLGPYEIVAPLGAGGMGEVYRALDTRLDRTVAIKILPAHLSDDVTRRQRFEREAKVISSLNHPNICTLHDVGRQEGVDFIVMEYLEGETLAERLENGPLPVEQVLLYGTQIASALDKAHRSGVTHRDLKPGNIMLTKSGAKLLDFGLAKADAAAGRGSDADRYDTTGYAHAHDAARRDSGNRSLYVARAGGRQRSRCPQRHLLAGSGVVRNGDRRPRLSGQERIQRGLGHFAEGTRTDPRLQPLTPPALERTIRVCLAKDPDERWQSAGDLWKELRWISEGGSQIREPIAAAVRRAVRPRVAWILAMCWPPWQ